MQGNKRIAWLHGWGMSSRIWEDLSSLFPEAEHRYIDYGGCTEPEHYRAALRDLLDDGGGPWSLVGWSLGGMLALEQVICGQVMADSIVLIGTTLRFVQDDRSLGWPKRVVERMVKQVQADPQGVIAQFAASMLTPEELAIADRERLLAMTDVPDIGGAGGLAAGLAYLRDTDLRDRWEAWRAAAQMASAAQAGPSIVGGLTREGAKAAHAEGAQTGKDGSAGFSGQTEAVEASHAERAQTGKDESNGRAGQMAAMKAWHAGTAENGRNEGDVRTEPKAAVKLLWIHGEADPICPIGCMPGDLTERERVILPGAGHAPMVTQLARLEHDIRGFWYGD